MSFSFGGNAAGGSANNPFAPKNTSQAPPGGLFGTPGASTPNTSSSFGPPAASTAGSGPSIFSGLTAGSGSTPGGTFGGGASSNPGSGVTTPSVFGASTGNTPGASGGLFGKLASIPATTGAPTTGIFGGGGGTPAASSPFGGSFSFGGGNATPTANNENKAPAAPSGMFGAVKPVGTALFGAVNHNTSIPAGSMTPAKPTSSLFQTSTTPAGPPPTDNGQKPSGNLFGTLPKPSSGLSFGAPQSSITPSATTPTSKPGGLFGNTTGSSSLFGNLNSSTPTSTSATTAAPTTSSQPTFSFQSSTPAASPAPTSSAPSLFVAPNPATSATTSTPAATSGLFGNLGTGSSGNSAAPSQKSNMFSGLGGASTTATSTAPAAAPTSAAPSIMTGGTGGSGMKLPSFGLGGTPSTSAPATSSLFGNPATTSASSSSAATTSSLFNNPAPSAPASSAPATSTPTSGLFGNKTQTSTTQPTSTSATTTSGAAATAGASNPAQTGAALGSSTAGPVPGIMRLKNKTMDEIITKWASDLSKYQKDFKEQADKVAAWDRLMVENGEKIQKLFFNTFEAEKANNEIERQLNTVMQQQDELGEWLDKYESEVDEMFSRQLGDTMQGPDQEREKTYKLAEKLTDRLDEMGKGLTSMIEAINEASTTLSKTGKQDDPLSTIVRVLNEHLATLQWIDENASALQAKVSEAQKMGQNMGTNGYGGPDADTAESFYRSYLGRK